MSCMQLTIHEIIHGVHVYLMMDVTVRLSMDHLVKSVLNVKFFFFFSYNFSQDLMFLNMNHLYCAVYELRHCNFFQL